MTIEKIFDSERETLWHGDYPFGEIQEVERFLERSFIASPSKISNTLCITHYLDFDSWGGYLMGVKFVPDKTDKLLIRVPTTGLITSDSDVQYHMTPKIAERVMHYLVLSIYKEHEIVNTLGSGTLNIMGTGCREVTDEDAIKTIGGYGTSLLYEAISNWCLKLLYDSQQMPDDKHSIESINRQQKIRRLIPALQDEDEDICRSAIQTLAKVDKPDVTAALLDCLLNDNRFISETATALRGRKTNAVLDGLLHVLQRDTLTNEEIRKIAQVLETLEDPRAIEPLYGKLAQIASRDVQLSIMRVLVELGAYNRFLSTLMEYAKDNTNKLNQWTALKILGSTKDELVLPTLEQVAKANKSVMAAIALRQISAIGRISDPQIIIDLYKNSEDSWMKKRALETLQSLGIEGYTEN